MNRALRFIIIIAVSFAVASCYPLGYTHDAGFDDFWTIPQRQYYTLGDDFVRTSDLRAFASSRGMIEAIPASDVEIALVKNPDAEAPGDPIPIVNGRYRLISSVVGTGRKLVIVTYEGKTAEYSIEVRNTDGSIDPGDQGSGEGSGIGIIWR